MYTPGTLSLRMLQRQWSETKIFTPDFAAYQQQRRLAAISETSRRPIQNTMTFIAGATAYETHGTGPPLVLIHGLGLNRKMWQWQLDALTPCFTVVCYDLLGHGDSEKPRGPYAMPAMVDQISKLMYALELERAALVGFSLGGLIARSFALAHPHRATALVILNSAHARTPDQRESIMTRVRQAEKHGPDSTVDDALTRWFTEDFAASNPRVLDQVRRWVVANDPAVYPSLYRLLAQGDIGLETAIAKITCPVLVVTGEEDHGNSPQMAREMSALIPGARCVILPGLRHMALVEDPAAVNSLLLSFLSDAR